PRLEALEDRTAPAVLTVNSALDNTTADGALTLREALRAVNAGSTAGLSAQEIAQVDQAQPFGTNDTIVFDPGLAGQTVNLTTVGDGSAGPSALAVSTPLTIQGLTGGRGITIARDTNPADYAGGAVPAFRLFLVTGTGQLTLQDVTLSGGLAQG